MTDDTQHKATQIAFNFGPVNGHVLQQHIHTTQPKEPSEPPTSTEAEPPQEQASESKQLTRSQAVILFLDVYPKNIQQDAELVAKILEPYNSQAASDIRITYLDE